MHISDAIINAQGSGDIWGATVSFSIESESGSEFNRYAVKTLNRVLGKFRVAELPSPESDAVAGSRSHQVMGWVYKLLSNAEWPTFQLGTFKSKGDGDLVGDYCLPTRTGPRYLPFRLFRFFLQEALLVPEDKWNPGQFEAKLEQFQNLANSHGLRGASQRSILLSFLRRGFTPREEIANVYMIENQGKPFFFKGTKTVRASELLHTVTLDKYLAVQQMKSEGVSVVEQIQIESLDEAKAAANTLGYPVVLKPITGTGNAGVICAIANEAQLVELVEASERQLTRHLIEKHVEADCLRVVLAGQKIAFVQHRRLLRVTGDGSSSIQKLLEDYAKLKFDGPSDFKSVYEIQVLKKVNHVDRMLSNLGLNYDSVLAKGETKTIGHLAAVSAGTLTTIHEPAYIPDGLQAVMKKINMMFGNDVIGIDVLVPEGFQEGQYEFEYCINEVNKGPAIREAIFDDWFMDTFLDEYGIEAPNK